jgi:hypothetical protein
LIDCFDSLSPDVFINEEMSAPNLVPNRRENAAKDLEEINFSLEGFLPDT